MEPTDHLLWEQMRKGDARALASLFRRYYQVLYDYCVKLSRREELARDTVQEVFASVWEKRKSLSPAESVRAYLLVTARRLHFRQLEQLKKKAALDLKFGQDLANHAFSPEDIIITRETHQAEKESLQNALSQIPPRLREALYLKTYDNLSYKEIAVVMDITPQVARNYVAEAFARLRKLFAHR